jgi:hypothetical protein
MRAGMVSMVALLAGMAAGCSGGPDAGGKVAEPAASESGTSAPPAESPSATPTVSSFTDTPSLIAAAEAAGVACKDPLLLKDDAMAACDNGLQLQGGLDAKEKADFVDLFATGNGLDMGPGSVLVGEDWAASGLPRLMTLLQAALGGTIV